MIPNFVGLVRCGVLKVASSRAFAIQILFMLCAESWFCSEPQAARIWQFFILVKYFNSIYCNILARWLQLYVLLWVLLLQHFWLYSGALPDSSELLMASIDASSSNYSTSVLNSSICNVGCRQNQGPFYSTEILYAWC